MIRKHLDNSVNQNTAFSTYAAMLAMCRTGYAPSLRRTSSHQETIGLALEADGCRVFWG